MEVSTNPYTNLVNTAQQLKVSKAGTGGDVRILIRRRIPPTGWHEGAGRAAVAFCLVSFLAWAFGVDWHSLRCASVVEDPETIETQLGFPPVYATIPTARKRPPSSAAPRAKTGGELLAIRNPEDDAIESLRARCTTIHFALMDAPQLLLITGSSPGLGKSFISKPGCRVGKRWQRIVIIDADLRKGHINKEFGLPAKPASVNTWWAPETGRHRQADPCRTCGSSPPARSRPIRPELLMHSAF